MLRREEPRDLPDLPPLNAEQTRRSQYRVEPDASTDLRLSLKGPEGTPYEGDLVDVSASGAGARFVLTDCPKLAVGQEIDLVFHSKKFATPVRVAAKVQHRAEEENHRRYGFRFLEPQQLEAHLPANMRQLFNRRKEVRVEMDQMDHVTVTLETHDASVQAGTTGRATPPDDGDAPVHIGSEGVPAPVEAKLHNLSTHGARLSLDGQRERDFSATSRLTITIALPDRRHPVTVVGDIRYRALVGRRIHYGIEFNAELTGKFRRQQSAISKFVSRRRLDEYRESA